MSVVTRPARYLTADDVGKDDVDFAVGSGDLRPFAYGPGFVMLETRAISPPSMAGRKIRVCLEPRDVDELLLALRELAIAARRATLSERPR